MSSGDSSMISNASSFSTKSSGTTMGCAATTAGIVKSSMMKKEQPRPALTGFSTSVDSMPDSAPSSHTDPLREQAIRVKQEDSSEIIQADQENGRTNGLEEDPHQVLADILANPRLEELSDDQIKSIETELGELIFREEYTTLASFRSLLNSKISLEAFQKFLARAAEKSAFKKRMALKTQIEEPTLTVKRPAPVVAPSSRHKYDISNSAQVAKIDDALSKVLPFPKAMGCYDAWTCLLAKHLLLNDSKIWNSDQERIIAVIAVYRVVLVKATAYFSETRYRRFISFASKPTSHKLGLKEFWVQMHETVSNDTGYGYKWGILKAYGGWPGFDRLELRMNSIARLVFQVNSWRDINKVTAFNHMLAAMTPNNLWQKMLNNKIFEDAEEYFTTAMRFANDPQFSSTALKRTFGIPGPDEVDRVGLGTLRISCFRNLDPAETEFIANPLFHIIPEYISMTKGEPIMLSGEIRKFANGFHDFKSHRFHHHWDTLKMKGGWPGYEKLNVWMNMIARESFGVNNWKEIESSVAFMNILGAATPPPIWSHILRFDQVDDALSYYNAVMRIRDSNMNFGDSTFLKLTYGIPYPSEVERVGFGTLPIHPLRELPGTGAIEFYTNSVELIMESPIPFNTSVPPATTNGYSELPAKRPVEISQRPEKRLRSD